MSILDYFKHKKDNEKITKNTMVYGVCKQVLFEGEISPMDYLMLSPFNRKEYVLPCFFLAYDDAMTLRNAYNRIKVDGERYVVFEETYNNIFGNGQSPFKVGSHKLYHSYDEFVAERKNEYKNNQSNDNVFCK